MGLLLNHSPVESIPLPDLPKGRKARVYRLCGESAACQRLREMGFCERAEVKVVANHGGLICQVCGSKVALSKRAANAILVEPLPLT